MPSDDKSTTRFGKAKDFLKEYFLLIMFLLFPLINIGIFFIRLFFNFDVAAYMNFYISVKNIVYNTLNLIQESQGYAIFNFIILVLVFIGIALWIYRCYVLLHNLCRKHITTIIITCVLIALYILFFLFLWKHFNATLEYVYRVVKRIGALLAYIFNMYSVADKPTSVFGINLILRFIIFSVILWLFINLKALWNYFFVDKIPYYETSGDEKFSGDDEEGRKAEYYISRFVRFFYDRKENKLIVKNIVWSSVLLLPASLLGVSVYTDIDYVKMIDTFKVVLDKILQISTVSSSPFAEPMPLAGFINILIRIVSVIVYAGAGYLLVSTILYMRDSFNGIKRVNKKKLFNVGVNTFSAAVFIFLINNNSGASRNIAVLAICSVIGAVLSAVMLLLLKRLYLLAVSCIREANTEDICSAIKKETAKISKSLTKIATRLLSPLYEELTKDQQKYKVLYASANFCAIASLLTTFIGLVSFFRNTILTVNILMSVITVIICFCITVGIQYSMLKLGIFIGKYFVDIFKRKSDNEADGAGRDIFTQQCVRILVSLSLLVLYSVPMTVSSLFSFASLFGSVADVAQYREIVNNDVWNAATAEAKDIMSETANTYNHCNENIEKEIENAYNEYTRYYNIISAWENVYSDVYGDKDAKVAEVDQHAQEFEIKTRGIDNYKKVINTVLIEDRYNNYYVEQNESDVFYGSNYLYKIAGYELKKPYESDLNYMDEIRKAAKSKASDAASTPGGGTGTAEDSFNYSEPIKSKYYGIGKYQLLGMLVSDYTALMDETIAAHKAAVLMETDSSGNISEKGKLLTEGSDTPNAFKHYTVNNITNTYYNNINNAQSIFEAYLKIRDNILSDPDSTVNADDFSSVNQLTAAVLQYAEYNLIKRIPPQYEDYGSAESTKAASISPSASPLPYDELEPTAEKQNVAKIKKSKADFNTKIERLTKILSFLPEVKISAAAIKDSSEGAETVTADEAEAADEGSEEAEGAKADKLPSVKLSVYSPTLPRLYKLFVEKEKKISPQDSEKSISDRIRLINEYANYANSRDIDLAFGLDVVYAGKECKLPQIKLAGYIINARDKISTDKPGGNSSFSAMNPHRDAINDVYEQSTLAIILLAIAFIIDLMPIVIGVFMRSKEYLGDADEDEDETHAETAENDENGQESDKMQQNEL